MQRRTFTSSFTDQRPRHLASFARQGYLGIIAAITFLGYFSIALTAQAQRSDEYEELQRTKQYFDGLRSRGLYSLAETICHRKLDDRNLGQIERCQYAVELSRTLTQHSQTVSTLDDQTELLKQARQAIVRVLENRPNHPQKILLDSQLVFVEAFELESLRWRVDLAPYDQELTERSRLLADTVIPTLQHLDQQADDQIRIRKVDALGERLLPHQLRALRRAIQLRLGLVFLEKARLYPESTPDRSDALVKASEILRQLAAVSSNDQTMWQSQLAYTTVLRLRGTPAAAWAMVNAIREDSPPVNVQNSLAVEHVELLITEDRYADAAEFLRGYRTGQPQLNGPLNFQLAKVLLRLSQIAAEKNRPELATELRQEVHHTIQLAISTGNSYWASRAQSLLADEQSRNAYGEEVGALVREGQSLFAQSEISKAAERYALAFVRAQQQSRHEAAAEIGYTYGSILLKQKLHSEAAQIFAEVTSLDQTGSRAADADLLGAWCLGMMFRETPTRENRETYMAALNKHRTTFPESPTSGEATWMLAQLQEQRLQTTEALKLYVSVPGKHPRYEESLIGIARCSETILNRLRRLDKPRAEWEQAIVNLLGPYIQATMNLRGELTTTEAEFLIRTSRILISLEQPDYEFSDEILNHILTSASKNSPDRQTPLPQKTVETATGLRIISLTGRGNTEAATELLKSVAVLDRDRLSVILSALSSAAEHLSEDQRKNAGTIQLTALQLSGINPAALSEDEVDTFGPIVATAFELTGQTRLAVQTLNKMLNKRPKDATIRRRTADLLLKMGEPTDVANAQLQYRKIEGSLKAGSVEWMDARVHVIELAIKLKKFDEARKLLKITQLLYPNPGADNLTRRLNEASATLASTK